MSKRYQSVYCTVILAIYLSFDERKRPWHRDRQGAGKWHPIELPPFYNRSDNVSGTKDIYEMHVLPCIGSMAKALVAESIRHRCFQKLIEILPCCASNNNSIFAIRGFFLYAHDRNLYIPMIDTVAPRSIAFGLDMQFQG